MISHVHIGTNDPARAERFYAQVLPILGLVQKFSEPERGWFGWMGDAARPLFLVGAPENGQPHTVGNGQMTALLATSRQSVDDCYAAALAAGAECNGRPGLRPEYHPDYYGAYFRDLDGNKICVCCHTPE